MEGPKRRSRSEFAPVSPDSESSKLDAVGRACAKSALAILEVVARTDLLENRLVRIFVNDFEHVSSNNAAERDWQHLSALVMQSLMQRKERGIDDTDLLKKLSEAGLEVSGIL